MPIIKISSHIIMNNPDIVKGVTDMIINIYSKNATPEQALTFSEKYIKYQKENDCKLIIMYYKEKSWSIFWTADAKITIKEASTFAAGLRNVQQNKRIDIILNTTGGELTAAEVIAKALLIHPGEINIYIPHYAMSAGVIISLADNKIYLARNGFMGPIDPQIGWGFSAQSIIDFTKNISEKQSWIADIACLLQGPKGFRLRRNP